MRLSTAVLTAAIIMCASALISVEPKPTGTEFDLSRYRDLMETVEVKPDEAAMSWEDSSVGECLCENCACVDCQCGKEATIQDSRIVEPVFTQVMLTASWCGPCQVAKRSFPELERNYGYIVTTDLGASASLYVIDIDQHPEWRKTLGNYGLPCYIQLKDGKPVAQTSGLSTASAIKEWFKKQRGEVNGL